ncbi:phosphopantetheine-binding protein [Nocardia sp. NBC_00881]|uniref:phosphopantetheine-binding protein n=1 Tax=Nocardia sp. NBC_00881 TaxID=2975995 RepID=UPI00386A635E|nr:phosphopantetheine-binding protein [Nocardia sp. NBC_00881]
MTDSLEQVLRDILIEDLDVTPEEMHPDADLVADLGFDSLSFATGVVEIRDRLGVSLAKDDVFSCRTLGDLQRLVANKLAATVG